MTDEHKALELHLKKATSFTSFLSAIIALICAMSVGYGFYYQTSMTLNMHTTDIKEVQSDVSEIKKDVQAVDVFKGVSEFEVKALEDKITNLEGDVSKMDEKLDKILLQTR